MTMQRVIVIVDNEQLGLLTDFLVQNNLRYSTEFAHASDALGDDAPYENLLGLTAEDIARDALQCYGLKLSVMNCHRVLDAMDEDDYDSHLFEETVRRVFNEHPSK
jgi:hypothetical protein